MTLKQTEGESIFSP